MDPAVQIFATVASSMLGSAGLWSFLSSRTSKKDYSNRMLIGLAHDRIMELGMKYLDRGDWITYDEYENLNQYLYDPYEQLGGNGSAKRLIIEINSKLRLVKFPPIKSKEDSK